MSSDQAIRVMVVSAVAGVGSALIVAAVAPAQNTVSQVAMAMIIGLGVQYYSLRKWG